MGKNSKEIKMNKNKIKLDLGCGENKRKGFIGIDNVKLEGVDIVHDLNKGIPYKNDSVDEIFTRSTLEHLDNPLFILEEIHRVLKKCCKATILVPHFSDPIGYHFLHKSYWSYNSLNFLEKDKMRHYYTKINFKILKRYIYLPLRDSLFVKVLQFFINSSPNFFEWVLCPIIKAEEIEFVIQKI